MENELSQKLLNVKILYVENELLQELLIVKIFLFKKGWTEKIVWVKIELSQELLNILIKKGRKNYEHKMNFRKSFQHRTIWKMSFHKSFWTWKIFWVENKLSQKLLNVKYFVSKNAWNDKIFRVESDLSLKLLKVIIFWVIKTYVTWIYFEWKWTLTKSFEHENISRAKNILSYIFKYKIFRLQHEL